MTNTIVPQLIFTLSVAREIASWEGPDYDLVVYLIQEALKAAKEEASRHGIIIEFEQKSKPQ